VATSGANTFTQGGTYLTGDKTLDQAFSESIFKRQSEQAEFLKTYYDVSTLLVGTAEGGPLLQRLAGRRLIHSAADLGPEVVVVGGRSVGAAAAEGYRSFSAFKRAFGSAGAGRQWHHVVEQTDGNVAKFGAKVVHVGGNWLRIPEKAHSQLSAFYSSIQPFTNGQTVRQWLAGQSFNDQYKFGLRILSQFGGPWPGM
jgi:hypothetical protein